MAGTKTPKGPRAVIDAACFGCGSKVTPEQVDAYILKHPPGVWFARRQVHYGQGKGSPIEQYFDESASEAAPWIPTGRKILVRVREAASALGLVARVELERANQSIAKLEGENARLRVDAELGDADRRTITKLEDENARLRSQVNDLSAAKEQLDAENDMLWRRAQTTNDDYVPVPPAVEDGGVRIEILEGEEDGQPPPPDTDPMVIDRVVVEPRAARLIEALRRAIAQLRDEIQTRDEPYRELARPMEDGGSVVEKWSAHEEITGNRR